MKEIIKLCIYLLVVCAIAGTALSGVNHLTKNRIAKQNAEEELKALKEVLPGATTFKSAKEYREGFSDGNEKVGYVLNVKAAGYSSIIEAIVGIDTEFKIKGVKVLSQAETPGLGTKITKESFLSQFAGKRAAEIILKKDGGKIDAITAATISSRAITNAIRERINEFEKTLK